MEIGQKQSFAQAIRTYADKRMAGIFVLGVISGFPWVLIGSALSLWLKEEGMSRSVIGWSGLIFGVYAINYLWAPLIDCIRIPYLTQRVGHRRAWIFCMQAFIFLALCFWSLLDPTKQLFLLQAVSGGALIAFASATQDITIDALRIEKIGPQEGGSMQAGAAIAVMGWWTGYKIGGMITLFIADYLQDAGVVHYWQTTFLIMTLAILACNIGLMLVNEPSCQHREKVQRLHQEKTKQNICAMANNEPISTPTPVANISAWIVNTLVDPIASFLKRNGSSIGLGMGIIAFVFLFKIGEAFLGRMSIVFYNDIGFSKSSIALYSKGLGWLTTITFTMLGGIFAIRSGVIKAMFLSGILMSLTNIFFALLYWSGKSELLFALAVVTDDMTSSFATVSFVAFISMLVDRSYTATQYALLASLGTLGRTTLASSSGALVDWLNGDWGIFFALTALMVIPSLLCLWYIKDKLSFSNDHAS